MEKNYCVMAWRGGTKPFLYNGWGLMHDDRARTYRDAVERATALRKTGQFVFVCVSQLEKGA